MGVYGSGLYGAGLYGVGGTSGTSSVTTGGSSMPQADTPHFDIPFRFEGAAAPTVEQDSYEDVANCVETIIRTPLGFRANTPNFGLPNVLFDVQPVVTDDVVAMIAAQEPRSVLLFTETRDLVDALMDTIMVEVR